MNWFTCFWVPYFYYDAWAMYKVYTAKAANIKDCSTVMSKVKSFFKSEPLMLAHHFFLPSLFGFGVLVSGYRDCSRRCTYVICDHVFPVVV